MEEIHELWVGEISPQALAGVEQMLAGFSLPSAVTRKNNQARFTVTSVGPLNALARAELASKLSRLGFPFELLHIGADSERYSFIPSLGIHRVSLNQVGEELLSSGMLELLMNQSGGSNIELRRLIARAIGEPWTRAIELIRETDDRRVA